MVLHYILHYAFRLDRIQSTHISVYVNTYNSEDND